MDRTRTPLKLGKRGTGSFNKQLALRTSPASATQAGIVKRGIAVVNCSDATTVITQLNALLASLRTAGVIAP